MKSPIRKLKLDRFEMRVMIDALNARRIREKNQGIDTAATSDLLLMLLDIYDS